MTPTELRDIAHSLGTLISHATMCRGMSVPIKSLAELARIAVKAEAEADALDRAQVTTKEADRG